MSEPLYYGWPQALAFALACLIGATLLDQWGFLSAGGPIVSAPVPGPCGCGGRCCQAADSSLDSTEEVTEPCGCGGEWCSGIKPAGSFDCPGDPEKIVDCGLYKVMWTDADGNSFEPAQRKPPERLPLLIEIPPPPEAEPADPLPIEPGKCGQPGCQGHAVLMPGWDPDCPVHGAKGFVCPHCGPCPNHPHQSNPYARGSLAPIPAFDFSSVSVPVVPALQVIESEESMSRHKEPGGSPDREAARAGPLVPHTQEGGALE